MVAIHQTFGSGTGLYSLICPLAVSLFPVIPSSEKVCGFTTFNPGIIFLKVSVVIKFTLHPVK